MVPDNINSLLKKVEDVTRTKKLDLSSDEDLSIGVMNLISAEEHLFFTYQKTGKDNYLELLNEVRTVRKELLQSLVKDYEGEIWCIGKHLLGSSMRLIEVGTKYLAKGEEKLAQNFFSKAYQLYSLFWGLNLGIIKSEKFQRKELDFSLINNGNRKQNSKLSLSDKLGIIIRKVVDCCKE